MVGWSESRCRSGVGRSALGIWEMVGMSSSRMEFGLARMPLPSVFEGWGAVGEMRGSFAPFRVGRRGGGAGGAGFPALRRADGPGRR